MKYRSINQYAEEEKSTQLLAWLEKNEHWVHFLFWSLILLFPFLKSLSREQYTYNFTSELIDFGFGVALFYIAYFLFIPARSIWWKRLLFLGFIIGWGYFNFAAHNLLFGGTHQHAYFVYALGYISTYIVLILFAYALFSLKTIYKKQLELEEAIRQKQAAELSGLKAQINPHFLFNTLNTIYGSALNKEDRTAEMVVQLADNFRYLLVEGQKNEVPIAKEIRHLRDYIQLQKARLAEKVKVHFEVDLDDQDQGIAPLLFLPFVENAFKYSSALSGAGHELSIRVRLANGKVSFYCQNPFDQNLLQTADRQWQQSGIGIQNTKSRLQMRYPGRHELDIVNQLPIFKVALYINL